MRILVDLNELVAEGLVRVRNNGLGVVLGQKVEIYDPGEDQWGYAIVKQLRNFNGRDNVYLEVDWDSLITAHGLSYE